VPGSVEVLYYDDHYDTLCRFAHNESDGKKKGGKMLELATLKSKVHGVQNIAQREALCEEQPFSQ